MIGSKRKVLLRSERKNPVKSWLKGIPHNGLYDNLFVHIMYLYLYTLYKFTYIYVYIYIYEDIYIYSVYIYSIPHRVQQLPIYPKFEDTQLK